MRSERSTASWLRRRAFSSSSDAVGLLGNLEGPLANLLCDGEEPLTEESKLIASVVDSRSGCLPPSSELR